MLGMGSIAKKVFGTPNDRKIKATQSIVDKINALEDTYAKLSDDQIREKTEEFKKQVADGMALDDLLPDAFANAREGAKRALGLRAYDVQLMGGIFLHQGNISEMKTGEGKTLVAVFPAYLNALTGRGVHVVTVNDYLAARDAEWMGRVYTFLGLTCGVVPTELDQPAKIAAYKCDVVYGTNNELGFDYLRDNMKPNLEQMCQRDHYFAIVDEVDSILIDEARTPLIISGPADDRTDLYTAIDKLIPELNETHYVLDEKAKSTTLSDEGNEFVEQRLHEMELLPEDQSLYDPESTTIVHHVNQGLRAHILFKKDKDYIVRDNAIVLIDEFTGRMMTGRRLSEGLHQAIEAKEGVQIQPENVTLASVTFQNYFRLYEKLAGMTGTAQTEAEEFAEIYNLGVVEVPTNKPIARIDEHDAVYRTANEKFNAIVEEIAKAHHKGQPILVGTTSIDKSEFLSNLLKDQKLLISIADKLVTHAENAKKDADKETFLKGAEAIRTVAEASKDGIPHNVLNARFHEQEAQIVADAGMPGAVTIATNMAGRGTDIQLGGNVDMRVNAELEKQGDKADVVAITERIKADAAEDKQKALDAGGLFVLATERHESRRIDNQLRGRSGRQGDPGRSAFFLSLEDDLMRIFGSERLDAVLGKLGMAEGEAIIHPWVNKSLEKAQAKVEGHNFDIRKQLLKFDDVMNDQRKAIFEQRLEIMKSKDLSTIVKDMRDEVIDDTLDEFIPPKSYPDQWDIEGLDGAVRERFNLDAPIKDWAEEEGVDDEDLSERLSAAADQMMAKKATDFGPDAMREVEKQLLLQTIDTKWREHLITLEQLRSVVSFRGYAQRDPLNEYKTEAFGMFESMLESLRGDVTQQLSRIRPMTDDEKKQLVAQQVMQAAQAGASIEQIKEMAETAGLEIDFEAMEQAMNSTTTNAGDAEAAAAEDVPVVGRNEQCPCGSGKKYKHCHGKL